MRVTGSEIIGVVPLSAMLEAGKYFLEKQNRSTGIPEKEILKIAVKSLGLGDLCPFIPEKKIIEYILRDTSEKKLVHMNLTAFAGETASESPAPGGGSVSAYTGALGVSLATMVANISSHKAGWDSRCKEFSTWAVKGMVLQSELLSLVDEDTKAFNRILEAFGLPKDTEADKAARKAAIQIATRGAIEVPLMVMRKSYESFEIIKAMVLEGNPNSVTDAGVGALCARTAVKGAFLNVKINASALEDKEYVKKVMEEGSAIEVGAVQLEEEIMELLQGKMGH